MYLLRYSRNQSNWEGNHCVVTKVGILIPGSGKGCRGWTHGPSYIMLELGERKLQTGGWWSVLMHGPHPL